MPIREMAIRALGACGGGDNVPQLVAELERHEDLSYDNVVVESLGLIGHVSALDALNRQIRRLEQFKPRERMVQEVVQRALEITIAARDRIIKRGES
jgi:N-acetylglutamate synthase/N-acetylornithine aminotransferase